MAEYQVALRQGGESADVLARLAHGYAEMDRVEEASSYYSRLLRADSSYAEQALADFLDMARRAREQGDRARMARSLEQLQEIRSDAVPDDLALPFARYYYELGEYAQALPLYLSVGDSVVEDQGPDVEYELARSYKELGECGHALAGFRRYLDARPRGGRAADARWHAGECAFRLGREARTGGRPTEAMEWFQLVIELGAPQASLDEAWFEQGELLYTLGRFDEAQAAYERVLDLNPTRTGRLVRLAEDRIRAIRYRGET